MLQDNNAYVKQSKMILQPGRLLKLLFLEKSWGRISKNQIWSLECFLGLQAVWIYGNIWGNCAINWMPLTLLWQTIIHSMDMWHLCLNFGKLRDRVCNELCSSYL